MKTRGLIAATVLATASIAGVGQLAFADNNKAQAFSMYFYSTLHCSYDLSGRGYAYLAQHSVTDYSWGEEFWLGKRDSDVILRYDRTPSVDYKCNVRYA